MLIECSECGKQISSKATVCPNCGCPIEYNVTNKTNTQKKYMYMCDGCNNPFKSFNEYMGLSYICPDCGGKITYYETEDIDNETGLVTQRSYENSKEMSQNNNVPKCPTCGSTNIVKIGIANRVMSIGLFGLASNKIGKTYKCENCGYTW